MSDNNLPYDILFVLGYKINLNSHSHPLKKLLNLNNVIKETGGMAGSLRSAKTGLVFLFLSTLASLTLAQDTTQVNVDVDGNADTGAISGSPWLWLLFVAIIIIVFVTLTSRRRNS